MSNEDFAANVERNRAVVLEAIRDLERTEWQTPDANYAHVMAALERLRAAYHGRQPRESEVE